MKKNRKNKGFTLVELIVVLVILAILAAMLVPALTGYIDKANEKVVAAEARATLMAAQTLTSDLYGTTSGVFEKKSVSVGTVPASGKGALPDGVEATDGIGASSGITWTDIQVLAELPATGIIAYIEYNASGVVTMCYYNNSKYMTVYTKTGTAAGTWTSPEKL